LVRDNKGDYNEPRPRLRANINPSQFAELESANAVLKHWQAQFQPSHTANGGGIDVLRKPKPALKIIGFGKYRPHTMCNFSNLKTTGHE
jgi:hypothetical protein